jgi:hypothetical protein
VVAVAVVAEEPQLLVLVVVVAVLEDRAHLADMPAMAEQEKHGHILD